MMENMKLTEKSENQMSEEQLLKSTLYRYMTPKLADRLLTEESVMKGNRKEVSILVTHFHNYNEQSETLSLEALYEVLNQVFEVLIAPVFRHQGHVNQLVGADLIAVFSWPLAVTDHAWRAVQAAQAMRQPLQELDASRTAAGQTALKISIGINSGIVMSGNLGSVNRQEFTIIGHEVNVAKALSQQPHLGILLGENAYKLCGDRISVTELAPLCLNPGDKVTKVYSLNY
jgi:adenylate cyclase